MVYSDSSLGPELAAKPHIPNGRGAVGREDLQRVTVGLDREEIW